MRSPECVHLESLADELVSRGLRAHVHAEADPPYVHVANPEVLALCEDITARLVEDGKLVFTWSTGQVIGPVAAINEVAARVAHVLRCVQP